MKKKEKIRTAVIIVLTAIAGLVLCSPIFYRLYKGDRIRGTVEVVIDDETYSLRESDIELSDAGKVKINADGTADISIHAGEYGKYGFDISDTTAGRLVSVSCFQFNWWNVTTFELKIEMNTAQGTVAYSGEYSYIEENGNKEYERIAAVQSLAEDKLEVRIGA